MTYQPEPIELVRELRDTLGLFAVDGSKSPSEVWQETLDEVQRLMRDAGRPCIVVPGWSSSATKRCHCRPDVATYHYSAAAPEESATAEGSEAVAERLYQEWLSIPARDIDMAAVRQEVGDLRHYPRDMPGLLAVGEALLADE